MAKKAVAKKEQTSVTISDEMLTGDSGMGTENAGRGDFAIPFIKVLQKMSPQCDEEEGEYMEEAKPGMFMNTVNKNLYSGKDGIVTIPVCFIQSFTEWAPNRGGLVKDWGTDEEGCMAGAVRDDKNHMINEEGNTCVQGAMWYLYLYDTETGAASQCVMIFTSTQLKKSRRWLSAIREFQIPHPSGEGLINPAAFYSTYRLTTIPESNEHGNWYGIDFVREGNTLDLENGKELYLAARAFHNSIQEGNVKTVGQEDAI